MISKNATLLVWMLLGAYVYSISSIIRRWMQSDLTTNVLWRINVRLAITFVLGMLFVNLFAAGDPTGLGHLPYLAAFAFLIGITPDMFLRWINKQVKREFQIESEGVEAVFTPSDLQSKIGGMSFWQMDRLAEEGIENVEDLAMKEIPALLVKTRFDTPLLLNWVDRALLCDQVGDAIPLFRSAHILRATQLVHLARRESGAADVLASLEHTRKTLHTQDQSQVTQRGAARVPMGEISREVLENVVRSLELGPNLHYLNNYWNNVNGARQSEVSPTFEDVLRDTERKEGTS